MSTSTEYTNGRLVVDEETAFDILEMAENRRVLLLQLRADARDFDLTETVEYLSERIARLRRLTKRIDRLCVEKGWGETDRTDLPRLISEA